jgi:hypothetical protein
LARCLLALVCLAAATGAWAQKRVALLIGNSAYAVAPLVNPANDAADLATALKSRGFETVVALNTTKRDINTRVRAFADQITPGTVALFYYAGHGMQVRGRNYILPVDAKVQNEGDVVEQGVEIDAVLQRLEGKGAAINLVILDACRNNPFTSAKGSGLAAVDAPQGQPGRVCHLAGQGGARRQGPQRRLHQAPAGQPQRARHARRRRVQACARGRDRRVAGPAGAVGEHLAHDRLLFHPADG